MEVAGVDGCRAGWLVVRAEASDRLHLLALGVEQTFEDMVRATEHCATVAVDIPIGLSDDGRRRADEEARRALGEPRRRSVFPAPVRPALAARTYQDAKEASLLTSGASMTIQTFNILGKVGDADQVMTPKLQSRVVEVHPEVSFWALNGKRSMTHRKKSRAGKEERLHLLSQAFEDDLEALTVPKGAGRDDLYDACAAAWTAWRLARGNAERLPPDRPRDRKGLRMEIVY